MSFLRGLIVLLTIGGVRGNPFELSELIQRIHNESDSAAVYFVGIDCEFSDYFMKTNSDISVFVFTSLRGEFHETSDNKTATLVVEAPGGSHEYFEMLEPFISRLRVRKFVVISASSFDSLRQSFLYFAEKKFTRIFGVVESVLYGYLPFADERIQQFSRTDPLPDALKDLNGFPFRTALQSDVPRGFWYNDTDGERRTGGYVSNILTSFLRKHNATYKEVVIKDMDSQFMLAVCSATIGGEIDIGMNAYFPVGRLQLSYPIKILHWAIMVPINGYVDPNQYFLRPFSLPVWICIGLTLVYIVILDALKDISVGMPVNLWLCFSRTFLTVLNMCAEKPVRHAYRFYVQVLLLAFIIVNLYSIHLTSFLTVSIRVKQYETIQDLIEHSVPVMIPDYEWDLVDQSFHPPGFDKIVTLVDNAVFTREKDSMNNTNFAYAVGNDKAEFLVSLQAIFTKPRFHVIADSLDDYFLGFLLAEHSPFREILDVCIIQIMDSGLMDKWTRDAVLRSVTTGIIHMEPTPEADMSPLTLEHLRFAWTCLVGGLTIALVIFMIERYRGGSLLVYTLQ